MLDLEYIRLGRRLVRKCVRCWCRTIELCSKATRSKCRAGWRILVVDISPRKRSPGYHHTFVVVPPANFIYRTQDGEIMLIITWRKPDTRFLKTKHLFPRKKSQPRSSRSAIQYPASTKTGPYQKYLIFMLIRLFTSKLFQMQTNNNSTSIQNRQANIFTSFAIQFNLQVHAIYMS